MIFNILSLLHEFLEKSSTFAMREVRSVVTMTYQNPQNHLCRTQKERVNDPWHRFGASHTLEVPFEPWAVQLPCVICRSVWSAGVCDLPEWNYNKPANYPHRHLSCLPGSLFCKTTFQKSRNIGTATDHDRLSIIFHLPSSLWSTLSWSRNTSIPKVRDETMGSGPT